MILLNILLLVYFIFSISSVLTLCSGYGSYRKVYKSLKNRKFYRNGYQIYSHEYGGKDDGFVWFLNDNHFRLERSTYLHATFITYLDPYSCYWLMKYRNWFKNISVEDINNYIAKASI